MHRRIHIYGNPAPAVRLGGLALLANNSEQVLSMINYFSTARYFDSYDFSKLYTSITHVSLKHALATLIKWAYRVIDNIFLVVDNIGLKHTGQISHIMWEQLD